MERRPAWSQREIMLWAVHEWVQDRGPGEDMIFADKVATLFGREKYVDPTLLLWPDLDQDTRVQLKVQDERINTFLTLVNEFLIDATLHRPIYGQNLTNVTVRGLTGLGERQINEMRDPTQELLSKLDDLEVAIRSLQTVSDEEKTKGEKAVEELKGLARNAAPSATVQLLLAWIKSQNGA